MIRSFQYYAEMLNVEPFDRALCKNLKEVLNEVAGKQVFTENDLKDYYEVFNTMTFED